ncbi:MAG: uroporphyrinogen decarboxylase family protein, partial [Candidatus Bathyarchaeia archaeon]
KCVDLIVHRGWYENTQFWPPRLYRKFIAPMLKREAEEVHRRGLKFGYIVTTGIMPILSDIVDCGVDLLLGVDPVQDHVDLKAVKEKLEGRVCIWGGVNSAVTLRSSCEVIGKAVREAVEKLAPGGGFILGAVDAVFKDTPPRGLKVFIDAWRKIRSYPYR